jgi:hypothetical protein
MKAAEDEMNRAKAARDLEQEGTDEWKQRQSEYLRTVEIFEKTKED